MRLYRWPVKSLAGEALDEVPLREHGLPGDRAHAVVEASDRARVLSARQVPRLLAWSAAFDGAAGAEGASPEVTSPAGTRYGWDDESLPAALSDDLGRTVTTSAAGRNHDRPDTVLVTTEATRRALQEELGSPVDVRRFRTNLHLDLRAPAYAEERWEGAVLRLASGAALRFTGPCERCTVPTHDPDRPDRRRPEVLRWLQLSRAGIFGAIARVERPGPATVDDEVTLGRS